jgi:hypothetical protein
VEGGRGEGLVRRRVQTAPPPRSPSLPPSFPPFLPPLPSPSLLMLLYLPFFTPLALTTSLSLSCLPLPPLLPLLPLLPQSSLSLAPCSAPSLTLSHTFSLPLAHRSRRSRSGCTAILSPSPPPRNRTRLPPPGRACCWRGRVVAAAGRRRELLRRRRRLSRRASGGGRRRIREGHLGALGEGGRVSERCHGVVTAAVPAAQEGRRWRRRWWCWRWRRKSCSIWRGTGIRGSWRDTSVPWRTRGPTRRARGGTWSLT